jgi:hypothetical protein
LALRLQFSDLNGGINLEGVFERLIERKQNVLEALHRSLASKKPQAKKGA